MLRERGYQPVEDSINDEGGGDYMNSNRGDAYQVIPSEESDNGGGDPEVGRSIAERVGAIEQIGRVVEEVSADDPESITVKILDVRGQNTYPVRVTPRTTIAQLKRILVVKSSVEFERQRIIHGGKVLADGILMSGLGVSEGSVLHLFQRPKGSYAHPMSTMRVNQQGSLNSGGGGLGGSVGQAALHPGGLGNMPEVFMVQDGSRGGGSAGSSTAFYNRNWELERARRGLRFLASVLALVSTITLIEWVLESLAFASAAIASNDSDDNFRMPVLVFWVLLKSTLGAVVGMLGIRASQSLDPRTVRLYFWGLVLCAILATAIRIDVLWDVVEGEMIPDITEVPPSETASSSGFEYGGSSTGGGQGGGAGEVGGEGGGGDGGGPSSAGDDHVGISKDARSNFIFSAFLGTTIAGVIWLICVLRAYQYTQEIHSYTSLRASQEEEMHLDHVRARAAGDVEAGAGEGAGGGAMASSEEVLRSLEESGVVVR